ncbi:tyrosine-type recombinase/integrase [Actinosynnema sp. NPDC023658]|uniref:tyrosine-type recombinase/integrase n=1 Tax=Actinosynnema sp. NPDC023658 TaxID=3155465 RepID=UPI0034026957
MGHVTPTDSGKFRANWREPDGKQRAKTFKTRKEANAYLADVESAKNAGRYVNPHAGRTLFAMVAERWLASRNDQPTTIARDASIMANHVLAKWAGWPVGKIEHLDVQDWVTELGGRLAPATVAECHRLMRAVLGAAVRHLLIGSNPADGVRLPARRVRDTDGVVISRELLRTRLLPAVPDRYRAVVAMAAGTGQRWGETIADRLDVIDLDKRVVRVVRTIIEVGGHTSYKPFPKTKVGRREIPLPSWLVPILREHMAIYQPNDDGLIFTNEAGGPLRRTLFRSRVWKPSLVRAGLLGEILPDGDGFEGRWSDDQGVKHVERFAKYDQAVRHVAKLAAGGMTFHDLRHSYATWLVDDGVPVNMAQRVLGHEHASTTLQLYTRRTLDHERILKALDDDDDDGLCQPVR